MENEENNKIEINGKRYYNLEEVPEPFRAALQARIDAARAAGGEGGPALSAFLKFLIKLAPPPLTTPRAPKPTGFAAPQETPGNPADLLKPGAINPSSSGMLVWIIIVGLAAFYWFYSK